VRVTVPNHKVSEWRASASKSGTNGETWGKNNWGRNYGNFNGRTSRPPPARVVGNGDFKMGTPTSDVSHSLRKRGM